jgi:hypothetical protein
MSYEQKLKTFYMKIIPGEVVPILTEEDYKFDPYMTLQDYVAGREWREDHQAGGDHGYFEYEGGWCIVLKEDNMFELIIEDKFGTDIYFGKTHNLHDLEIKLHAYESLRWANMVW